MFRYKSYKKSIIMTALVILLCLVSLTGATLALFTSNPDDGTIGVIATAGDITVDIVDTENNSLKGATLQFITTSGKTESKKILFEPGAAFHTQGFKVVNQGNVPIKFTLSISKDAELDIEEFKKAFEFWIVEENEDGSMDFDNSDRITEFRGELDTKEKRESKTYYLFIKMKETVGNEFQGKTYSGIGVTVYAVQGNGSLPGEPVQGGTE